MKIAQRWAYPAVFMFFFVLPRGLAMALQVERTLSEEPEGLSAGARLAFALAAGLLVFGAVAPPDVGLLYQGLYRTRAQPGRALPSRAHRDPDERPVFREDGKDASITVDGWTLQVRWTARQEKRFRDLGTA